MSTAPDDRSDMHASHLSQLQQRQSATSIRTRAAGFVRKHYWIWPIFAALCFALADWMIYAKMKSTMLDKASEKLVAIRSSEIRALQTWAMLQERQTVALAPIVAGDFQQILNAEPATAGTQTQIRGKLKPRLKEMRAEGFFIVDSGLRVVAASGNAALDKTIPKGDEAGFFTKVLAGVPGIMAPRRLPWALVDSDGIVRADPVVILVAVPIGAPGTPKETGVLCVAFQCDEEFSGILRASQFGKSGESYAFEATGAPLSKTLFPPHADNTQRPQLCELVSDAQRAGQNSGLVSYFDYRGVFVIGSWEWLKDFGFGVATTVDEAEAIEPLSVLLYAFVGLFAVLMLSALGLFVVMRLLARQHDDIQEALNAAKQLGQYHLEEKLGEGGMGVVFKASHAMLRRPTAVKLLSGDKISAESVARFEREVQATSQLNHPNTICIYDYGRTPSGDFYYAMEYLDGIDLESLIKEFGPQSDGRVIHILKQICGSLAEAHDAGLIHRDIKPANILLNRRGGLFDFVKVLDFGLVKPVGNTGDPGLTAVNAFVGTPLFVSPEMFSGPTKCDARSDLYAVGAVGWFLLTGKPVFEGRNMVALCAKITKDPPPPISPLAGRTVSPSLERVILACLEKNPDARPTSAGRLIDLLDQCEVAAPWKTSDAEAWWRTSFPVHSAIQKAVPQKSGDEATLVVKKI